MNELKRNELRNTKLDVRKPDGTIDLEKSKAFQELVTGGDIEKYCGHATSLDVKKEYENACFLYVRDSGMMSLGYKDDESYFKLESYKEITFEPETKYVAKLKDTKKQNKIKELEAKIKSIQDEVDSLKGGAKPTHYLDTVKASNHSCRRCVVYNSSTNGCFGIMKRATGIDCIREDIIFVLKEVKK